MKGLVLASSAGTRLCPITKGDSLHETIDFDVFAKGPDQLHAGFQKAVKWCEVNGKQVVIIP